MGTGDMGSDGIDGYGISRDGERDRDRDRDRDGSDGIRTGM
jgi:hypothetical protein